jgi:signal transduction histidine kinase/FixJ family two-component response regulator
LQALRLEVLADAARLFAESVVDLPDLLDLVARKLADFTGDACTVRLRSPDGAWLQPVRSDTPQNQPGPTSSASESGIWNQILRSELPRTIPPSDPSAAAGGPVHPLSQRTPHRVVGAPLVARGRVIGGISLTRYRSDAPFSREDKAFFNDFTGLAALAIDNAHLLASEIGARREAEEAMQRARDEFEERQRTQHALNLAEDRMRHMQKLDAAGQLAAGIAHDLNNVLSVILGYGSALVEDLRETDPVRADVKQMCDAGQRAASLTRQLLAFSRQQILEPRVINLNGVVQGMEKMLGRLIREDVSLVVNVQDPLHPVLADTAQLEQVLVNLVVNARDAMPEGGELRLETFNVHLNEEQARAEALARSGDYVKLVVSDSGTGMTPDHLQRIFEPFFTTKPLGKGTGLGLSTVYGIVKQSGGHISVESKPGRGSRFSIYLPVTDADGPADTLVEFDGARREPKGSETILLVEDEQPLRIALRSMLDRHGYTVVEAQNGNEALGICLKHGHSIDLLLTDVVMPHMSGVDLAGQLLRTCPNLRVLCMSGYSEASLRQSVTDSGYAFLSKPITRGQLLGKVRQVLSSTRQSDQQATTPRAPRAALPFIRAQR